VVSIGKVKTVKVRAVDVGEAKTVVGGPHDRVLLGHHDTPMS